MNIKALNKAGPGMYLMEYELESIAEDIELELGSEAKWELYSFINSIFEPAGEEMLKVKAEKTGTFKHYTAKPFNESDAPKSFMQSYTVVSYIKHRSIFGTSVLPLVEKQRRNSEECFIWYLIIKHRVSDYETENKI